MRRKERNENSRIRGERAAVAAFGEGRAGLCGGRGSERLPLQPRTGRSKDGEERGVKRKEVLCLCPLGEGDDCRNKINTVEPLEGQGLGRGRA